jgi:SAM-dependent methyltransferase
MHTSALRIGGKFIENYFKPGMQRILEIGSQDVNGSLRVHQPRHAEWLGVDINPGPGVDMVIDPNTKLPFSDGHFDLVIASSVFEHDVAFWKTTQEMARVLTDTGYMYINAPSNGAFHRHPLDFFRFYPDAGFALLQIVKNSHKPHATLLESFVIEQNQSEEGWSDFVAVIGASDAYAGTSRRIYETESCRNVWDRGEFVESSLVEVPEDQEKASKLPALEDKIRALENEVLNLQQSFSWRATSPLRFVSKVFLSSRRD